MEQAKEIEMLHWNTDDFKLSENLEEGSAVIVYGADKKGRRVYHWLKRKGSYRIVGLVERKLKKIWWNQTVYSQKSLTIY